MSSTTIVFAASVDAAISEMRTEFVNIVIDILAIRFGFDAEEAHRIIDSETKTKIKTRVQCPHCPKTYSHQGGLKQHMDKHHESGSQPKYQCSYCDKNHACSGNLTRHLLSCKKSPDYIKPSEGKFLCEECNRAFKTKGNLVSHCNNKNHICNE